MVEVVEAVAVVATGAVVSEIVAAVEAVVVEPSIQLLHQVVEALSFLPDRAEEVEVLIEAEAEVAFVAETAVDFAEGIVVAFEVETVVAVAAVEVGPGLLQQSTCEFFSVVRVLMCL